MVCPGSRTVRLIPNWANSTGGAPYSFSKAHLPPLLSANHHSASRTLTTNHPWVTGVRPDPKSSSFAPATARFSHFAEGSLSPAACRKDGRGRGDGAVLWAQPALS